MSRILLKKRVFNPTGNIVGSFDAIDLEPVDLVYKDDNSIQVGRSGGGDTKKVPDPIDNNPLKKIYNYTKSSPSELKPHDNEPPRPNNPNQDGGIQRQIGGGSGSGGSGDGNSNTAQHSITPNKPLPTDANSQSDSGNNTQGNSNSSAGNSGNNTQSSSNSSVGNNNNNTSSDSGNSSNSNSNSNNSVGNSNNSPNSGNGSNGSSAENNNSNDSNGNGGNSVDSNNQANTTGDSGGSSTENNGSNSGNENSTGSDGLGDNKQSNGTTGAMGNSGSDSNGVGNNNNNSNTGGGNNSQGQSNGENDSGNDLGNSTNAQTNSKDGQGEDGTKGTNTNSLGSSSSDSGNSDNGNQTKTTDNSGNGTENNTSGNSTGGNNGLESNNQANSNNANTHNAENDNGNGNNQGQSNNGNGNSGGNNTNNTNNLNNGNNTSNSQNKQGIYGDTPKSAKDKINNSTGLGKLISGLNNRKTDIEKSLERQENAENRQSLEKKKNSTPMDKDSEKNLLKKTLRGVAKASNKKGISEDDPGQKSVGSGEGGTLGSELLGNLGAGGLVSAFKNSSLENDWRKRLNRLLDKALGTDIVWNPNLINKRVKDAPPGREDFIPKFKTMAILMDCSSSMGYEAFKRVIDYLSSMFKAKNLSNVDFWISLFGDVNSLEQALELTKKVKGKNVTTYLRTHAASEGGTDIYYSLLALTRKCRRPELLIILTDGEIFDTDKVAKDHTTKSYVTRNRKKIIWIFPRLIDMSSSRSYVNKMDSHCIADKRYITFK